MCCISFYQREEQVQVEIVLPSEAQNNTNVDDIIVEDIEIDENQETEDEHSENQFSLWIRNIQDFSNQSFTSVSDATSSFTDIAIVEEPISSEVIEVTDNTEEAGNVLDENNMAKQFSMNQSNILFFLFVMSFALVMGTDVAVQKARWSGIWAWGFQSLTFKLMLIFLLNLFLWVDFIRGVQSQSVLSFNNGKKFQSKKPHHPNIKEY